MLTMMVQMFSSNHLAVASVASKSRRFNAEAAEASLCSDSDIYVKATVPQMTRLMNAHRGDG